MPASGFWHNTRFPDPVIAYKRDEIVMPWPYEGRLYVAWAACLRDDGHEPPNSPHRNDGLNCLYRDNSVKFVYRPDTPEGWEAPIWYPAGSEAGNWYDGNPIWTDHLEPAFNQ